MMFEWYSMFANTRSPARLQAFAKTSAEALMPLPWGPPIIQESRFFCIRKSYSNLRMSTRRERDTLGEVAVPADALYGAQTARAVENFPISGFRPFPAFIRATILVKKAAAMANAESGRLTADICRAIVAACDEILAGKHLDEFVVDVFQAGAGTSHNMNANEVIANRANEILGAGRRGEYATVNPNDHVNMSQSTNDVTPTAIRLALLDLTKGVSAELDALGDAFSAKAAEYASVVKPGRTHLQDAVPMTFGQEFGGWASLLDRDVRRMEETLDGLYDLAIGG